MNTDAFKFLMTIGGLITIINPFMTEASTRIRSFTGPYSVQMRENTDQKTSKFRHFSRSEYQNTGNPCRAN